MRVSGLGRSFGGVLRPLRRRLGDERGSTLVAVIGIAAVIAVVILALVSSVVFAIGQTTSARANVSAKAASEAGIETAAAQVAGGVCWVGGTGTSTTPSWKAQVQRLTSAAADPALEASWVNGCPAAGPVGSPTTFRVISTGKTGIKGSGNHAGDVSTIVAQFTVVQRPSTPEFNQAIFGDVQLTANTNLTLTAAAGGGDILTDHMVCSTAMNTVGSVYINSSLSETSTLNTTCNIQGDLITKGNLNCPADGSVHGDVVAAGNVTWNSTCHVYGNMVVGGNLSCPTSGARIDGDLTVVGNFSISSTCIVGGNIYVGGALTISNTLSYPKNIWVKGNIAGNGGITLTAGGSVRVGGSLTGGLTAARVIAAPKTIPDPSLPAPTAPDMTTWFPVGAPSQVFPRIGMTDARWSGWTQRKWTVDLNAIRTGGPSGTGVCNENWVSGSSNFSGPLTITTPTIYDLTAATASGGCAGTSPVGLGGGLRMVLYSDAVLFVPGANFVTGFRVESGDGVKHSLYVVEPWPSSMTSCSTPPSSIKGINLHSSGSNSISQGPNSQLMIYTPGAITASGTAAVSGQLYGCQVNLSTSVTLDYLAATAGSSSAGRHFVVTERFRMDNAALMLS